MQTLTILTRGLLITLVAVGFSLQIVYAEPSTTTPQAAIAEFAKCSHQCMTENEQCHKKQAAKCDKSDANCYESCDMAYPTCMAKCPRPGT